jgi:hypothetical protein
MLSNNWLMDANLLSISVCPLWPTSKGITFIIYHIIVKPFVSNQAINCHETSFDITLNTNEKKTLKKSKAKCMKDTNEMVRIFYWT